MLTGGNKFTFYISTLINDMTDGGQGEGQGQRKYDKHVLSITLNESLKRLAPNTFN
jgi:hypothetical protein